MTDTHTALEWLQRLRETVTAHDVSAHLALISESLRVYPTTRRTPLDYTHWATTRRDAIEQGRLTALSHGTPRFRVLALRRIVMQVEETLHFADGQHETLSKHWVLEREADDHWRLVEEQIKAQGGTPGRAASPTGGHRL